MVMECTTQNLHKANIDETSKDNKKDHKFITCTHIDKEWGRDFAGTNEPVALCTPPWPVLRDALFGIVQSMKEDDERCSNKNATTTTASDSNTTTVPPVDIAYVVVVSADARVKKTNPRPRRRSMLTTTTTSKYEENNVAATSTVTATMTDNNGRPTSSSSTEQPKYKLIVDDDDNDYKNDDKENNNNHFNDTNTNVASRSTVKSDMASPSFLSSSSQPSTATAMVETTRPQFRLCYE